MAEAREARFRLIGDWARETGLTVVALGHTADDQAEGFLMALARQAGLDGLSGMRPQWHADGLTWARPLLGQTRAALRSYLIDHDQPWIEDPTNDNPAFARVRMRRALAILAPLGLDATKFAASATHLQQTRQFLTRQLAQFAQTQVHEVAGALVVSPDDLRALDPELQRRFLSCALRWIGGGDHPPRADALARFQAAALAGRSATLAGVRLRASERTLRFVREPRSAQAQASLGALWDGRWRVEGPGAGVVRALGADGLAQATNWRALGLPRDALIVTPSVWSGTRLIAAPCVGFGPDWTASLRLNFISFLNVH